MAFPPTSHPVRKPSLRSRDFSQKNIPVSMQCRTKTQPSELLTRHESTVSGGQSVLVEKNQKWEPKDLCHHGVLGHLPEKAHP